MKYLSILTPSGAGAGANCKIFQISQGVGANASNFDGEITAVRLAAEKLATCHPAVCHLHAVFFMDSQAAIIAIADNSPTDCPNIFRCRVAISHLLQNKWTICLQLVPSHVGVAGNERADDLAKNGAQMQQPHFQTSLISAKHHIDATIKRRLNIIHEEASSGKRWASLITNPLSLTADWASAVASFRLQTGHDYLQAHLHRFGLADSDICPLCQYGTSDADHINTCPELDDQQSRCGRYWEARRRMVQQPRAGIG